jgi:hypothetical protein
MNNKGVLAFSLLLIIVSLWLWYAAFRNIAVVMSIKYMVVVPVIFLCFFMGAGGVYYYFKGDE